MKRIAMITGAEGGIGRALCKVFQEAGYSVIATDRKKHGKALCDHYLHFDILRFTRDAKYHRQVRKAIRKLAGKTGISVLVNNAAVQRLGRTKDVRLKDLRESLDTNLVGPFLLSQLLLDDLQRAKGVIINVASVHAFATKPGFVTYATTKAALAGLTRAMAVDLGSLVRVNAIAPAATKTPMLLEGFKGKLKEYRHLEKMHPIGRIAETEEVARTALYLASEGAGFITGATICVDGGIGVRLHDPL